MSAADGKKVCLLTGAARADEGIDLRTQGREVAVEQPGLLNELEMAREIRVQAHEEQAGIPVGLGS